MPLIHDNPWLIEQLLQSVAQDAGPPPPNNQQEVADAMRALLLNLRNQADPSSRGVIEHGTGAATLGSQNMESMGDFIEWLAKNQTKYGGKQVVYPGNTNAPSEDYDFYKIEPGTKIAVEVDAPGGARPASLPRSGEVGYWVQTDALKQYLVSLQKDEKLRTNVTFQVQLVNLIRFANEQLDTGLSETYKEVLPDTTVLDTVPNPIDPHHWGGGTVPLTYADVKSLEALGGWIKSKNISVKKKNQTIGSSDLQRFKICDVIVALYHRAYSMTRAPDTAKAIDAYKSAMAAIAKQSNCNVSSSGGDGDDDTEGGNESGGQGGTTMSLEQLAGMQVFNTRFIDVRTIVMFADAYAAWANANGRGGVAQLKSELHGAVSDAQKSFRNIMSPIVIGSITRQQFTEQYVNGFPYFELATRNLITIITNGQRMLQDFIIVFSQNHGGLDGSAVQKISRQIPIAQQNINDVMRIKSMPDPGQPHRR
jgi:hypothetical protein